MQRTLNKYFAGRKIKSEHPISKGSGLHEFAALMEAEEYLREKGHTFGSLDHPNPLPFWYDDGRLERGVKWHNLSKKDKLKLNGCIVASDFRNGDVKIIFFQ